MRYLDSYALPSPPPSQTSSPAPRKPFPYFTRSPTLPQDMQAGFIFQKNRGQRGETDHFLALMAWLHFLTESGAQQMTPEQQKFPPHPLHPKWQHSVSICWKASSLHTQQEQKSRFSAMPPQKTPQKFHQQQSQTRHWHIFNLSLSNIITGRGGRRFAVKNGRKRWGRAWEKGFIKKLRTYRGNADFSGEELLRI